MRAQARTRSLQKVSTQTQGFTLIEVIGVLAVMATLMAILIPNVIRQIDEAAREAEEQSLKNIGQGVEVYLRTNNAWPATLSDLSPTFVPFSSTQLTQNNRGHPRYFIVNPATSTFDNTTGLSPSDLGNVRFLLISDVSEDANPNINNLTQFNNWWNTDETATPDLKIYRGQVSELFSLLSLSAVGAGGSYRIAGLKINSGGDTLDSYAMYHLTGTVVEVDEDNNFSQGNFAFGFTLTSDAGYQFDPSCQAGSQWHVLGSRCS